MKATLALVQTHCTANIADNMARQEALARKAAAQGANIILLQELYRGQYFCQTVEHRFFDDAEPMLGPSWELFSKVARETGTVIVVPIFEKAAPGLYYNSLFAAGPEGQLLGTYRKLHIPDDPGFSEKFYFAPGDQGFQVIDTPFGKIGTLICWDQWYPEAARALALMGAQLILYPTAIGWSASETPQEHREQLDAWLAVQRGHAVANGVYVAAANRVGVEGEITFWGNSYVYGPFGQVLAQAGTEEAILLQELDYDETERTRRIWPFLRDRRIDAYPDLRNRWLARGW